MSASPVRMVLEIQSPVSGEWSSFEKGEHEVADAVLEDIRACIQLSMGNYVQVIDRDGQRYTCRYTPESCLRRE
jgi:ribulose bisphosphate carboxylase small subunit